MFHFLPIEYVNACYLYLLHAFVLAMLPAMAAVLCSWHSALLALQVLLPHNLPAGLLFLEAQRGPFMGPELPILVAPTAAMAQESLHLLHSTLLQDRQGLITDLGFILGNNYEGRQP